MILGRFILALVALAMLFAPVAMPAAAADMSGMTVMSMADHSEGHCDGNGDPAGSNAQGEANCCLVTCSALPPSPGGPLQRDSAGSLPLYRPALVARSGLDPEAATPPPRLS